MLGMATSAAPMAPSVTLRRLRNFRRPVSSHAVLCAFGSDVLAHLVISFE